jgi:plasmid maintenance system killer protein
MIVQFDNDYLETIFQGIRPKGKPKFNEVVVRRFIKTIKLLKYIENVPKLSQHVGLNFESLKGPSKGKYSVRVDQRYRIIMRIEKTKLLIEEVLVIEDLTDHYKKVI